MPVKENDLLWIITMVLDLLYSPLWTKQRKKWQSFRVMSMQINSLKYTGQSVYSKSCCSLFYTNPYPSCIELSYKWASALFNRFVTIVVPQVTAQEKDGKRHWSWLLLGKDLGTRLHIPLSSFYCVTLNNFSFHMLLTLFILNNVK